MQPKKAQILRRIRRLQREVNDLCRRFPGLDRSLTYQTLILLQKTPLERLNLALLRAEKKTLHL